MKLNKEEILKLVDDGYILMNKHPEKDLYILNYSKTAQFEQFWNEYTLMCRGMIVDGDFNIIARPFKKFFNASEHDDGEIPTDLDFEVFEKCDGSLGILFNYEGEWMMSTRGSFTSDQAIKGYNMLCDMFDGNFGFLDESKTYLFEILYEANRIVVKYDEDDLVLLGVINTITGAEMSYEYMVTNYSEYFTIVKKYYGLEKLSFDKILELEEDNREGFVLKYSNGFKIKLKFKEYVRLHRILTNISNRSIWDALRNGSDLKEIIENVPDEFFDWVKETKRNFLERYMEIERDALKEFWRVYHVEGKKERKDFALEVKDHELSGILFILHNGNDNYSEQIWKMLRPKYAKPFADDEENV